MHVFSFEGGWGGREGEGKLCSFGWRQNASVYVGCGAWERRGGCERGGVASGGVHTGVAAAGGDA